MPKVSVIVPVYKVKDLLPACLNSISCQTYQDFELILVDDGSPDDCGAMCDAYAALHENTKVIHQQNAGLSEARNQGVKYSTGEYITFIDSDDIIAPDYIEYLLYLLEKYGTEVSVAGMQKFWDEIPGEMNDDEVRDMQIPVPEALIQICYNKVSITAWGKLYKRDLVEKYPYPKGQLYEDTATTHKIVGDVPAIAYGTKKIYYWRQRRNSITHANITRKHLFGITAAKEQIAYMQERYPEVVPAARVRCAMKIVDLAYRLVMGKMDRVLFEEIRDEIKPLCSLLWHDKRAGIALKIRSVALCWGIVPFRALSLLYTALQKLAGKI